MLAAHLLCLLVAQDVASAPSYRRTIVQSQATPILVEGDISVPQSHLGTGEPLSAFLAQPSALWPRGLVSYRIETFEWEGKVEPIFSDEGVANITQALGQIMRDVPCIKFRYLAHRFLLFEQLCEFNKFREVSEGYRGAHLLFTAMGGPKCFPNVGRVIDGGGQLVNLGSPGCTKIGVVLHETLHALGLHPSIKIRLKESTFIQVLSTNTQDQTGIFSSPSCTRISSRMQGTTLTRWTATTTTPGTLRSIQVA